GAPRSPPKDHETPRLLVPAAAREAACVKDPPHDLIGDWPAVVLPHLPPGRDREEGVHGHSLTYRWSFCIPSPTPSAGEHGAAGNWVETAGPEAAVTLALGKRMRATAIPAT